MLMRFSVGIWFRLMGIEVYRVNTIYPKSFVFANSMRITFLRCWHELVFNIWKVNLLSSVLPFFYRKLLKFGLLELPLFYYLRINLQCYHHEIQYWKVIKVLWQWNNKNTDGVVLSAQIFFLLFGGDFPMVLYLIECTKPFALLLGI